MNNESPIGFFDSGVGGLSVYAAFRKLLPYENTIYYGDLKNMPYGSKTEDGLLSFAKNILDYFKEKQVKAVVIACNTSSAVVFEKVKNQYDFKIYPIIQSCAEVIAKENYSNLVVFATAATVKSSAYKREIQKYSPETKVYEISCPEWTSFVEGGEIQTEKCRQNIEEKIAEAKKFNPDKIILGCTHYPYLMDVLTKFMPQSVFLDPAEIFAEYIYNDLNANDILRTEKGCISEEFVSSANSEAFIRNSQMFYPVKICKQL